MKTLLLIPTYNDSQRLSEFLPALLSDLPPHFEVRIFDDGSCPQEKEQLRLLYESVLPEWAESKKTLSLQTRLTNIGKGASIQEGWQNHCSKTDLFGFADADGAVSAQEIRRAEEWLRHSDTDALFGSRISMLGRHIKRSTKRHLSSRIFALLVNSIGKLGAYDTQCGLKLLKKSAYQRVSPHFLSQRFAFDVELALLLKHLNVSTSEFPVDWYDIPGSKVNLFRDSIKMAKEVLEIKTRIDKIPLAPPTQIP